MRHEHDHDNHRIHKAHTDTQPHLFRLEQEALYELMADRIEVVRGVISVLCQRLRAVTS